MAAKVKSMTKSAIFQELAAATKLSKKQVSEVFDALVELIKKQLKKAGPGVVTLPGLLKLRRVETKAKPQRAGKNPLTGAAIVIPAKPASKTVRARVLKAVKDWVK
jgi:nucleoid DNA-binding protein